ncbi:MAG: universal stress protein [Polyangia bacterium]
MSESTRYRIVVGIDFSEISSLALDAALDTARHSDRPELHVVAVVDDAGHHLLPAGDRRATIMQTMDHVRELLSNDTRNALARQLARHAGAPTVNTIIHVRLGAIPENLAGLATELRADLLVVGTHGRRGLRRLLLGSVAERTARIAPCPVLIVRPKDFSALDGLPAIEPACPACLAAREKSDGATWWCDVHSVTPLETHTFSFSARLDDVNAPRHHLL